VEFLTCLGRKLHSDALLKLKERIPKVMVLFSLNDEKPEIGLLLLTLVMNDLLIINLATMSAVPL